MCTCMSCMHVGACERVSVGLWCWLPRPGPRPALSLSHGLAGLSITSGLPGSGALGLVGMAQLSVRWQRCPVCPAGVA